MEEINSPKKNKTAIMRGLKMATDGKKRKSCQSKTRNNNDMPTYALKQQYNEMLKKFTIMDEKLVYETA